MLQIGLVDLEINRLTKILFLATILLSLVLLALKGFSGLWFVFLIRFVILFSYIIPIRYLFIGTVTKNSCHINKLARCIYQYMKNIP